MPKDGAWLPEIDGKVKARGQVRLWRRGRVAPLRSVRTERYKLIENLWTGKIQLFDTIHDPGEMHDLYGHEPGVQAELLGKLTGVDRGEPLFA